MNLAVLESEEAVRAAVPDLGYIRDLEADGLAITGPGEAYDCTSRYSVPHCGIDEDLVTGSAHYITGQHDLAGTGFTRVRFRRVVVIFGVTSMVIVS